MRHANGLVGRWPMIASSWTDPSTVSKSSLCIRHSQAFGFQSVYIRIWSAFAWTLASNLYMYDIRVGRASDVKIRFS